MVKLQEQLSNLRGLISAAMLKKQINKGLATKLNGELKRIIEDLSNENEEN
jgi:hypothetical protein